MIPPHLMQAAARYSERHDALQRWQFGPSFTALKDEFRALCKRALATHHDLGKLQRELGLAADSPLLGKVRKYNEKVERHPPQDVIKLSNEETIRFKNVAHKLDTLYRSKADRTSFPLAEGDRCNYKMLRASGEALELQSQQIAHQILNQTQSLNPELASKSLLQVATQLKRKLEATPGVCPQAINKVHSAFGKVAARHHIPFPSSPDKIIGG